VVMCVRLFTRHGSLLAAAARCAWHCRPLALGDDTCTDSSCKGAPCAEWLPDLFAVRNFGASLTAWAVGAAPLCDSRDSSLARLYCVASCKLPIVGIDKQF